MIFKRWTINHRQIQIRGQCAAQPIRPTGDRDHDARLDRRVVFRRQFQQAFAVFVGGDDADVRHNIIFFNDLLHFFRMVEINGGSHDNGDIAFFNDSFADEIAGNARVEMLFVVDIQVIAGNGLIHG